MPDRPAEPSDQPAPRDAAWWLPSAQARRAFLKEDPDQQVRDIVDVTVAAWPSGATVEVPLGTIATIALLPLADPQAPELGRALASLEPEQLMSVLRDTWADLWCRYPYLVERAHLLYRWMADASRESRGCHPPGPSGASRRPTGVRRGTGPVSGQRPAGPACHAAPDQSGKQGQPRRFPHPRPDQQFYERTDQPRLSRRGKHRGGRRRFRHHVARGRPSHAHLEGHDPSSFTWVAAEIDPLAVGCLAANALLWRLGGDVIIAHADALAGDSGLGQARRERQAAEAHRDAVAAHLRKSP